MSIFQINNFVKYWKERGYEKGEKDSFWIDFLEKIFNISNWREYLEFEIPVAVLDGFKVKIKNIFGWYFEWKIFYQNLTADVR